MRLKAKYLECAVFLGAITGLRRIVTDRVVEITAVRVIATPIMPRRLFMGREIMIRTGAGRLWILSTNSLSGVLDTVCTFGYTYGRGGKHGRTDDCDKRIQTLELGGTAKSVAPYI